MPPTPKQPPPTEPGFLVNGTYYPMPQGGFTLGEARAIRRITGLTMQAFEAHLQEAQRTGDFSDPDVVAAFVYVAMHRADPHTTIEVVDGLVLEPGVQVSVDLGSLVRIVTSGEVAEEAHVHGYDLTVDVVPGAEETLEFIADIPGIFEAELEADITKRGIEPGALVTGQRLPGPLILEPGHRPARGVRIDHGEGPDPCVARPGIRVVEFASARRGIQCRAKITLRVQGI